MSKKKLKVPHVFALLVIVIAICSLLSYVIPAGTYQREQRLVNNSTRTVVVPGTYQSMEKHYSLQGMLFGEKVEGKATPASLIGFLSAVPRGMEGGGDIIFFIFMIGGVFGILQRTGVIAATIHKLLEIFDGKGPVLTVVIMFVLALGGSTLGMGEEFIPLIPIFLIVSKRMGYDRVYGVSLVIISAQVGFAAATTNPFTLNVAQGIAELQLSSGAWYRVIFFFVVLSISIAYVLRYGARIRRDPSLSLMENDEFHVIAESEDVSFNRRHGMILMTGSVLFLGIVVAVQTLGWWMAEMGGGFFLLGIIAALIAGLSLDETTKAFVKGMEEMVVAALVVGFAKGIGVVLDDAQVMDTVIHSAAAVLEDVPNIIAVQGMLIFQSSLNFIIPSGSGQAAVTMPLMVPLADVLGITRQTAVFAFQCGDGFSNTVIPTSGILMAMLSLAGVPYTKWLRFMLPLFCILMATSAVFLAIAVVIQYQ